MASLEVEGGSTCPATFVQGGSDDEFSEDEQPADVVWGRLLPASSGYHLIELIDDNYTFGRHESCTIKYTDPAISNIHCKISREKPLEALSQYEENEYIYYIKDKSSNGTYVDNRRIGKGNRIVLRHGAKIELTQKDRSMPKYVFELVSDSHMDVPHQALQAKYNLVKILGNGACGEVHQGVDKNSGRKYAVKIIQKKRFNSNAGSTRPSNEQLLAEVDILMKLEHPNIIHVHDMIDTEENLYIVLELARGGELFDYIVKKGKFTEKLTKFMFMQLLDAVKYLHSQNVAHRDLKPENVLLSAESDDALLKVTDFGLAKLVGPQSFMKTMCGTPSYQAPEVLRAAGGGRVEEGYGKQADLWSLGVILYIMLCGFPPFSEEITRDNLSLSEQITKGVYNFPSPYWDTISDNAKDLVRRLLVVNPDDRLSVDASLQHPFLQDVEIRAQVTDRQRSAKERRLQAGNTQTSAIKRRHNDSNGSPDAKKSNA